VLCLCTFCGGLTIFGLIIDSGISGQKQLTSGYGETNSGFEFGATFKSLWRLKKSSNYYGEVLRATVVTDSKTIQHEEGNKMT
jgi:hypothetical protein